MTIIKHRDICGLVGTLCGACIVTLVALGFGVAPARAQQNFIPLPPQVPFISNGKYTGTLQIQGNTMPITGTLLYLTGDIAYLHISADTKGQKITSNTWLVQTVTAINEWETLSAFPNTCRQEVVSPQCTAWSRNLKTGIYSQECTVTAQGNKTALKYLAQLSADNKLIQTTIKDKDDNNSITITMTSQGTTPPVPSDFNRPSICDAPTQGNELVCTGTIPNICF